MSSEESEQLTFTPELVVQAYAMGCFPMADSRDGEINWYRPDPRAVLPLDQFHVPKSLARRVRSGRFKITSDVAFRSVIEKCALPRLASSHFPEDADSELGTTDTTGTTGTWINDQIIDVYSYLNEAGLTHSIEAWLSPEEANTAQAQLGYAEEPQTIYEFDEGPLQLVGGLYGLAMGGGFFGESMFSRATDASRVCLVHLVHHLKRQGYVLLDTQIINPHMAQFGVIEIPDSAYEQRLHDALNMDVSWKPFISKCDI